MHEQRWSYATGAGAPLPKAEITERPPRAVRRPVPARALAPTPQPGDAAQHAARTVAATEDLPGLTRDDVMSVREVADLLDVTTRTVYRLVRDGQLPGARRIGRTVVVVRPVLEHWLLTGDR
ncbi:MAG: helix-turn-helix transcriptional regulator [Solirubrobacteraceae bacterium]